MKTIFILFCNLFVIHLLIAQPGPEVFYPIQMRSYELELAKDSTNDQARMGRIQINLSHHNTVQVESDVNMLLKRKEAGLADSTITYARLYQILGECYKAYVLPNQSITYYTKSLRYDSLPEVCNALFQLYGYKTNLMDSALFFYDKLYQFYSVNNRISQTQDHLNFYKIDMLKRFSDRSDELKAFYLECAKKKFTYYQMLISDGAEENSYSIRSLKEEGFDYLFSLIELYLSENEFKKAKHYLLELEPSIPHNSTGGILEIYAYYRYYKLMGDYYYKTRKHDKAWAYYLLTAENSNFKDVVWAKQLLEQYRNEPKVKVLVAKIYANNKEHENFQDKTGDLMALSLTEEALRDGATDFQLYVMRAKHFMASSNYEHALTEMNKAMKACPNYHWIPEYMIMIYKEMLYDDLISEKQYYALVKTPSEKAKLLRENVSKGIPEF
jgi:tetratricopeptide (TPR) repeat protein